MKFKVGQRVELINNSGMAAPLGATAIVERVIVGVNGLLKVKWEGNVHCQMPGHYTMGNFKPSIMKNQQLEFSFMD